MTPPTVPSRVEPAIERWEVPTPFPVGPVNAYRIPGAVPALVDAGPNTPEAREVLLGRVENDPVDVVLISHEHVDHAGLARTLQERGVEVWAHEAEAATLRRWEEDASERERDYQIGLETAGVPADQVERMRKGGRKYDAWGQRVEPDRTFKGGERLALGDAEWTVVDAPGHTVGSYLLTDGRVTFTGDTLLERITPNALSVRDSERGALVRYVDTLERLRGADWGVAHPGHGAPFALPGRVMERGLEHLRRRQEKIFGALSSGPQTVYGLVLRVFPGLPGRELFLAVSEVRGHLELLVHAARARRVHEGGVDLYAAK